MITVQVNENEIRSMAKQKIAELVQEFDADLVFWDANELKRRTCMSWNFIQNTFFFDTRFPKRKVGNKWYFPSKETRAFLETWLGEQSKH